VGKKRSNSTKGSFGQSRRTGEKEDERRKKVLLVIKT
jgi:hypothetical protein